LGQFYKGYFRIASIKGISESQGSTLGQQGFDLAAKHGQLALDHVPDEPVVHIRAAVDGDVAKGDYAVVLADALRAPLGARLAQVP
jgi:hypothetical protein